MFLVRFLDGPAAGRSLQLRRAPTFLRAALDAAGDLDALDQLDDTPEPGESVCAYRRRPGGGCVHVDYTDKSGRRRGAWFTTAEYAFVGGQPDDAVLRDTESWRKWCYASVAPKAAPEAPTDAP